MSASYSPRPNFGPPPSTDDIAEMAERALSAIPARLAMHVRGVGIIVEDMPDDESLEELGIDSAWELTGLYRGTPLTERSAQIKFMVEKPKPEVAPSNLAVVGRYVLPGRIFSLLVKTKPGAGGEIQLTDGVEALLHEQKVLAYRFAGTRYDCGSKIGLVQATIRFALDDPKLAAATRAFIAQQ